MHLPIRAVFVLGLASAGTAQSLAEPGFRRLTYATQLGAQSFPGGGASGTDSIRCSVRTPSGAVIVAGTTTGALGEANAGGSDVFVARITPAGQVAWVSQVGAVTAPTIPTLNGQPGGPGGDASSWDSVGDIVVDQDGTILITGRTGASLGETHVGAGTDLFVARFARDGALLWLRQVGSETAAGIVPASGATSWGDPSGSDAGSALALDPNGGFWVAGSTSSDLSEGNLAELSVLLAHFDGGGHLDGLQQIGEVHGPVLGLTGSDGASNATDLVLTAAGPLVSVTTDVFSGGDLFHGASLLAFDAAGIPLAVTPAPPELSIASAMAVDGDGRIYVTGSHQEAVYDLQYQFDAVAACYDPLAAGWCWSTRLDEGLGASLGLMDLASDEWPCGLALDSGSLVVAGYTFGSLDEANAGGSDLFVMKLRASNGSVRTVRQLGQDTAAGSGLDLSGSDTALDMYVTPAGLIGVLGSTTASLAEPSGGALDALALRLRPNGRL